jgi:hypothetical protein
VTSPEYVTPIVDISGKVSVPEAEPFVPSVAEVQSAQVIVAALSGTANINTVSDVGIAQNKVFPPCVYFTV